MLAQLRTARADHAGVSREMHAARLEHIALVREKKLSREQAYVLCSVAVDLRISNLVDVPNFAVTAILDLGVFDK